MVVTADTTTVSCRWGEQELTIADVFMYFWGVKEQFSNWDEKSPSSLRD